MNPKTEASWKAFEAALADPIHHQTELLQRILKKSADTEFGKLHGFGTIADAKSYRERVPVAAFADLQPYMERMFAGERDILFPGEPVFYARTSGTTGRPKHIPFSDEVAQEYRDYVGPAAATMERDHPGTGTGGLFVSAKYLEDQTSSGIPIGSAGGFSRRIFPSPLVPEAVFEELRYDVRYYSLLRFALSRSLTSLGTVNPSTLLTLFKYVEDHGKELAEDLERGGCQAGPPGTTELLAPFEAMLPPAPEAAQRLRASLERGSFAPRDVWPDLKVLRTWKGGSTKHYLGGLAARCPGLPIRSCNSGSSEACLLVPLTDESMGGVPAIRSTFFEFLPDDAEPKPESFVPITELKKGQGYRFCVTNFRGMYRHLMDDVFYVEGYERSVAALYFSHRAGLWSSLTGEKLSEQDVLAAVEASNKETPLKIRDFQVAPQWGEPPHYLLQIEPDGGTDLDASTAGLTTFLSTFERSLRAGNSEYDSKRESGRIGAPELIVLRPGEFDRRRREKATKDNRSDAQSKVPRINRELVVRESLQSIRSVKM